jgi:RsiW-degrading membrane proteinase PrsW (M82 family)
MATQHIDKLARVTKVASWVSLTVAIVMLWILYIYRKDLLQIEAVSGPIAALLCTTLLLFATLELKSRTRTEQ